MKALAILAGPRKGGCTDMLMDEVLKGLKETGKETEKIYLYDLNIKPCTGCCACAQGKKCVIQDDHQMLLDKMEETDILVFGSPVYWANVTSTAKAFMDRAGSFFEMGKIGPKRTKSKPGKIILVTTCGAPFPFSHLMGIIPGWVHAAKFFFGRMNAKIKVISATGLMNAPNQRPSQKQLQKAYEAGKSV